MQRLSLCRPRPPSLDLFMKSKSIELSDAGVFFLFRLIYGSRIAKKLDIYFILPFTHARRKRVADSS